jgi:hypothetical protein
MTRYRFPLGLLVILALLVTVASLVRATRGDASWMRYATAPVTTIVIVSWWAALWIDTRIAEIERGSFVPGLKQFVGMWFAFRHAPLWALAISTFSLLSLFFLGATGSVSGLASTPNEAQITGTALVAFLALSLPSLLTAHPLRVRQAQPNKALERSRVR